VSFDVSADAYARFMGGFSEPLAPQFADRAEVRAGHRVLDVGCGPGALTAVLVDRLGTDHVTAVDPSASFVEATRRRLPGVEIRSAVAEDLPFDDDTFDRAVAQLVVHFMTDPVAGIAEMARVTRPGGVVAACVWDHGGGTGPLSPFWRVVHDLDPDAFDETQLAGAREGHLVELFTTAGLDAPAQSRLTVERHYGDFDEWWEPFTYGVGPAGGYVAGLDVDARERLRQHAEDELPSGAFNLTASAWCATAVV
jgi:SAM-dependent methyltransferase